MPKIVELRQDRNLVQPNFDGYKLSLDVVPVIRKPLQTTPFKAEANDSQYSQLHAELFMQNLLEVDPWQRSSAYFVNYLDEIVRCSYNENIGRPNDEMIVYCLDKTIRVPGDYNYSFRFVSEKYCVLCDGKLGLQLFDTGDRLKSQEWKMVTETEICVGEGSDKEANFRLYDARLDTINEVKQISLALGHVNRVTESHSFGTTHYLHLHWARWTLNRGTWEFSILDTIESRGSLYYCAFEPKAESLVLCSNREFRFKSTKLNDLPTAKVEKIDVQLHEESSMVGGFSWAQTDEDITVTFDIQEDRDKTDYNIRCISDVLEVKCAEKTLLDQTLFSKVDPDLTTWTIENNFLQVTLVKHTASLNWPSLLLDGCGPKESLDNGKKNCLPMEQQPIPNLEAPIEDCDFPIGNVEDEVKIERFHLASKAITHCVFLGSTPPLFSTNLRPGYPYAVATRQDVDASLWLQYYSPSKPDEWTLRHEGNLDAFGYVQASKQQKKFIDCSPDMNYALVCEAFRHIFLYKSNHDGSDGLRNRSGPQVKLGKQHLITLEDDGEVLGVATAPNIAILLTEKNIIFLQIN